MDEMDEAIAELFAASDALYEELARQFLTQSLRTWFAAYDHIRQLKEAPIGEAQVPHN